ncbi:glycosyltransferase family 2 protein [Candidatus Entotheonella palauensis]|uniref:glycosyltransferase family 2 protein n=1 Tax=Candidatus Entotheonella palauensis TaxID=93172 RepID=UPI000B7F6C3B|nr:glycosyltransferase family A protein [Candidatus Entotheonella palauensis]
MQTAPVVSVVTPVYNGEPYLAECIESILAQTYPHWEYVIVNNCSTDRTLDIAQQYAQRDARIRIHDNATFLDRLANSNHALRHISANSKYCKIVHADDWLFPECIEHMIELAEAHDSVGIVGAYRLLGRRVDLDGLPYTCSIVPGQTLGQSALHHIGRLGGLWIFGSPTSLLLRSDLIRSRNPFYNESNFHADAEVCLDLLQFCDFGFVHQVLTYTRYHPEAATAFADAVQTYIPGELQILLTYGPRYLEPEDFDRCVDNKLQQYYVFLARSVFRGQDKRFWNYHRDELHRLGRPLAWPRLVWNVILELADHIFNPKWAVDKLRRKWRSR